MYDNTISQQCIDPPCLVKCSGQGGGFVSCSPKYIIKKSPIPILWALLFSSAAQFYSHNISKYRRCSCVESERMPRPAPSLPHVRRSSYRGPVRLWIDDDNETAHQNNKIFVGRPGEGNLPRWQAVASGQEARDNRQVWRYMKLLAWPRN